MPRSRSAREGYLGGVIAPHLDRLLAFARRLSDTPDDAEDLVQETIIRAWQCLDQLENPGAARAWLFRILHTIAVDLARTRVRRRALVDVIHLEARHEELVSSADAGPLEAVLASATTQAIEAALASIPDEFARAVELHDLHELKYREIAEVLGVPLGTVTSRISRGRRLLAAQLWRERALEGTQCDEGRSPT